MFGKEKFLKNKVMFLLIMDCQHKLWNIPEETLWLSFDDAFEAALRACSTQEEKIIWSELEVDEINGKEKAFLPECFEIMPISISTLDRVTWFGKERKNTQEVFNGQAHFC